MATGSILLISPAIGQTAEEAETSASTSNWVRLTVGETTRDIARAIDGVFGDSEYEEERNDTSLTLKLGAEYLSEDGWDVSAQPRLRLRLPQTEERLLLEIVGERTTSDSPESIFLSDELEDDDSDIGRLEFRLRRFTESGRVRLSPEVGVRFSDFMPQLFVGGRASTDWNLGEKWQLFASQRVRVHTDRGGEANTVLRANRPVEWIRDDLFRASFNFDWRADEPGVKYRPALALFTPLSNESIIAFETSVRFETDPEHQVDLAVATVRYRRQVIFDWWTAEIAPRVEFAAENDYEANYGARFRLEMEF